MPYYEVLLDEDCNGLVLLRVPKFPEILTFGTDLDDACLHGVEAVREAIAARIAQERDIPEPLTQCHAIGRSIEISSHIFEEQS
jgi:antitoxin HicB